MSGMEKYRELTGSCQCGRIRYRLKEDPVALYVCHCLHCQKQSSSAFGISMWMRRDTVEFTAGDDRNILSMKAGSLDDASWLQPTCHLWTKRKQPWVRVSEDQDKCYPTEPPSDEELMRQWAAARSGVVQRKERDPLHTDE